MVPHAGKGTTGTLGLSKNNMWYEITKEFDCKMSSSCSVCGEARTEAFTHRHLSQDKKEEISQLNYIIGPMRRNDEIYIHNAGRLWATWDHYPIVARIQEEPHVTVFHKKEQKVDGLEADNRRSINAFSKKEVMKNVGNKEENLSTVQKNIENAAKKIRHRTKAQREK